MCVHQGSHAVWISSAMGVPWESPWESQGQAEYRAIAVGSVLLYHIITYDLLQCIPELYEAFVVS